MKRFYPDTPARRKGSRAMTHPNHPRSPAKKLLPFIEWLKGYNARSLRSDAVAGLTVAVVLIPQAMAYAMLAGLPPVYGLYAA